MNNHEQALKAIGVGVTSAQLSAFEKGHKDLPVSADSAGSGE